MNIVFTKDCQEYEKRSKEICSQCGKTFEKKCPHCERKIELNVAININVQKCEVDGVNDPNLKEQIEEEIHCGIYSEFDGWYLPCKIECPHCHKEFKFELTWNITRK